GSPVSRRPERLRGGRRDRALRGAQLRPRGGRGVRGRDRLRSGARMRRGLAPALAALACLATVPAAAQAAPGDIAVADAGNWFGHTGRVLRVSPAGAAAVLDSGAPLESPW